MVASHSRVFKRQLRLILAVFVCLITFAVIFISLKRSFENNEEELNNLSNDPEIKEQIQKLVSNIRSLDKDVDSNRLLYTGLDKVGARTIVTLLKRMAYRLDYKHTPVTAMPRKNSSFLEEEQKVKLITHISQEVVTPCTFNMRTPFIDFTEYGKSLPIYLVMVRDPVELYISLYSMFVGMTIGGLLRGNTELSLKVNPQTYMERLSLDDCIMRRERRCSPRDGITNPLTMAGHFCGEEYECWTQNSQWALQAAKQNIDRVYKVVGVLEYMEETMKVLENVLPQFFSGISEEYKKIDYRMSKTKWKLNVSDTAKQILRNNLAGDYKLYDYLVMRLHNQYNEITQRKN